jgi:hypothetical protein
MALKAETTERAVFCSHCGAAVKADAEACPICGKAFEGAFRGQRCEACGALAELGATRCTACGADLQAKGGPEEEVTEIVGHALEVVHSLLEDRRAFLDGLEERIGRSRRRMEALEGATKESERLEGTRLRVWLKEAEGQRDEALRMSHGLVGLSDVLSDLKVRLQALPTPPTAGAEARTASRAGEGRGRTSEAISDRWIAAHQEGQRELFRLAREMSPEVTAALESAQDQVRKDREDLSSALEEIQKIIDDLPAGIQRKLKKTGKLDQIQALLGKGNG